MKGWFCHPMCCNWHDLQEAVQTNIPIFPRNFEIEINCNEFKTYIICCHFFLFATLRFTYPHLDFVLLSFKKTNLSTLVDPVDITEKPQHQTFFLSLPQICSLQEFPLESTNFDYSSSEYRVTAIILDIANYRLFRPIRNVSAEKSNHYMKIKFLNEAVNAINLPALL